MHNIIIIIILYKRRTAQIKLETNARYQVSCKLITYYHLLHSQASWSYPNNCLWTYLCNCSYQWPSSACPTRPSASHLHCGKLRALHPKNSLRKDQAVIPPPNLTDLMTQRYSMGNVMFIYYLYRPSFEIVVVFVLGCHDVISHHWRAQMVLRRYWRCGGASRRVWCSWESKDACL